MCVYIYIYIKASPVMCESGVHLVINISLANLMQSTVLGELVNVNVLITKLKTKI